MCFLICNLFYNLLVTILLNIICFAGAGENLENTMAAFAQYVS